MLAESKKITSINRMKIETHPWGIPRSTIPVQLSRTRRDSLALPNIFSVVQDIVQHQRIAFFRTPFCLLFEG